MGEAVKHTLALSAWAVLQVEMEILAWFYGKTSHAVQFGRHGTFVRLHWSGNLSPSIDLCFKDWCSLLLWKLDSQILEKGWTLANDYVVVLGSLLLLSKNVTFNLIF